MSKVENLKELVKHPGWQDYLDLVQQEMSLRFMELFQLEPTKPEHFVLFVATKAKIDTLRDMTYFIERSLSVDVQEQNIVDNSFSQRFVTMLKKLWRVE